MASMTELESLKSLPGDAPVWFFGAPRDLRDEEIQTIEGEVARFISTWASHRIPLQGTATVVHHRFIVIAVDPRQKDASGCSIDKLYVFMRKLGEQLHVDLLDSSRVYWRDAGGVVHGTSRSEFRQLAASDVVSSATRVFDLSVSTVAELGRWETNAGDSWHSQMLPASA